MFPVELDVSFLTITASIVGGDNCKLDNTNGIMKLLDAVKSLDRVPSMTEFSMGIVENKYFSSHNAEIAALMLQRAKFWTHGLLPEERKLMKDLTSSLQRCESLPKTYSDSTRKDVTNFLKKKV